MAQTAPASDGPPSVPSTSARNRYPAGSSRDLDRGVSRGARRDRAPRRAAVGGGSGRPVDARREPDQVASRAYDLVLRAIPARPASARATGRSTSASRFLFNSYYVAAGPRHARPKRGLITRPSSQEVAAYRAHVDAAVETADRARRRPTSCATSFEILEIGLNHEQQHQELILTDILHVFAENPDFPAYDRGVAHAARRRQGRSGFVDVPEGIRTIGHQEQGLLLRQRAARRIGRWSEPVRSRAASSPTATGSNSSPTAATSGPSCGSRTAGRRSRPKAGPRRATGASIDERLWCAVTLAGLVPVDPALPVCHVSYYEADAFARWAGKHLPSRGRVGGGGARRASSTTHSASCGSGRAAPIRPIRAISRSTGALGEYNGKFMVNQMVLRGSSLRDAARARARQLSQFLLSARRAGSSPACGLPTFRPDAPHGVTIVHERARQNRRGRRGRKSSDFARDVIAGLTARAQDASRQIFLRRQRIGAVRGDHGACPNTIRPAPSSAF